MDLGCGLGLDALACADAGLAVDAVEIDPVTAIFARANLRSHPDAAVHTGDAVAWASELVTEGRGAFVDPARRTGAGRTWRVEDFTPAWPFVLGILDAAGPACAKLGPGLPYALIPDAVEAEWVSDAGQVVEAALWSGPHTHPGRRRAVVDGAELHRDGRLDAPEVRPLGEYLWEPDGAVIRAGLVPAVADLVGGGRLHDEVAYLTSDAPPPADPLPWAEAFRVLDVLPYAEKTLRAWVRDHGVGTLEIKKRGIEVDPAVLRRRLKPTGRRSATLVLTPTPRGAVAAVVERVRTS